MLPNGGPSLPEYCRVKPRSLFPGCVAENRALAFLNSQLQSSRQHALLYRTSDSRAFPVEHSHGTYLFKRAFPGDESVPVDNFSPQLSTATPTALWGTWPTPKLLTRHPQLRQVPSSRITCHDVQHAFSASMATKSHARGGIRGTYAKFSVLGLCFT